MSRRLPPLPALGLSLALLVAIGALAPFVSRSGVTWDPDLLDLHLPRVVLGLIAGIGLAGCGTALQAVLRNPLADPYTLGISSGAALGVAAALQVPWDALPLLGWELPQTFCGALLGALGAAGLVYTIAARRALAAETLLLAGVAVALFSGALLSALRYRADTPDLIALVQWSLGSLTIVGWRKVLLVLPGLVLGAGLLLSVVRQLDVAALDDESARGLGVDPVRVRRLAFLGASLVTAGVVAAAGPIGFVGLVVPHAVRGLVGPDPRLLLPCSACVGGAFLVACDLVARTALHSTDLPTGVITQAIGCPVFVWILVRRR